MHACSFLHNVANKPQEPLVDEAAPGPVAKETNAVAVRRLDDRPIISLSFK